MQSEVKFPEPDFKSVSGRNLLIYTFLKDEAIDYQLEMLANNHVPGLLKSEVLRIDGQIRLSYDITSLIPLKKLFERRELGKKDFILIIKQIISFLEGLDTYLLDCGGVFFDIGSIYANPQNMKLEFSYLPIKGIGDDLEPLRNMLTESIMHNIRFKQEGSDNYVLKIFELLKSPKFDLALLKSYVSEMEINIQTFIPEKQSENPPAAEKTVETPKTAQIPAYTSVNNPREEKREVVKISYPAKSYMALGGYVSLLILLIIVLFITGTLSPENPDFLLSLFGLLLIFGALGYLVYSKFFTPDKRIEIKKEEVIAPKFTQQEIKKPSIAVPAHDVKDNNQESIKQSFNTKGIQYVNKNISMPRINIASAHNEAASARQISYDTPLSQRSFSTERNYPNKPQPGTVLSFPGRDTSQDHTVILDAGSMNYPRLKGRSGNETILMTKFPFMIGRLEEQVDYCLKNPAVGKLHAEIVRDADGYSIMDMNSRNGTMINGEKLEPSKSYRLNDGDCITIANEEFVFIEGRVN